MNKDIIILILSHGKLAQELYNTVIMLVGKVENIFYFNFLDNMSFKEMEKDVLTFIKEKNNFDILIFTDLFGGSCFNICSKFVKQKNIRIFSGVNLGILLEAVFLRNSYDLDSVAAALNDKKNDTIVYINEKMI